MWLTNNRPRRSLSPQGVVIHWTANPNRGADAVANRNYFENHPQAQASTHFIVDDKSVIRCIPENEVAWHAGGTKYTRLAQTRFRSRPNDCLLGIEMCVNTDSDWEKTYRNTVRLTADLLRRYGWSVDCVYRHYDITGKDCPRMMTPYVDGGDEYFHKFKNDVQKMAREELTDPGLSMFKDIEKGRWSQQSIERLASAGILSGTGDGYFQPSQPATREQVAVMLDRILTKLDFYR